MAASSNANIAELIAMNTVVMYTQQAANCLIFYEYAITLSDEVALVWGGGGCVAYDDVSTLFGLISLVLWTVFSGIRVYAISSPGLIVITRSCSIASDILVVAVTWIALEPVRLGRLIGTHSLAGVLLRDGIVYFTYAFGHNWMVQSNESSSHSRFLLLLSVVQIGLETTGSAYSGACESFLTTMTSIVISRMLLNMLRTQRDADTEDRTLEHATATRTQTQLTEWTISVVVDSVGWQTDASTGSSPEHVDMGQPQTAERVPADGSSDRMAV
ncbi:hypothetical protein WOLCODRAFT_159975 [Wolfiporia cocos MD-104 SS10]|uniref:DUF6533 domain-containing protein n=1 Tax=Wolfiporia cocos (strain MD-104) TaxID=742152 RepID=A0A2H3J0K2_WOLCO|nr:hypothetical protein WOLCODRAFT_159975 [Wolfiporia cocos MD-104 SS10]